MLPRRVLLIVILVAGVHAAGCADGTLESKRGAIRLEQSELTFAPTVVGSTSTMKFRVTNVSRVVAFDSNGNRLWGTPFSAMPLLQGRGAWALAVDDQGQIAVLFGTASWSDPSTSGALVIVDPQNGAVITWTDEVAQLPTRHVFDGRGAFAVAASSGTEVWSNTGGLTGHSTPSITSSGDRLGHRQDSMDESVHGELARHLVVARMDACASDASPLWRGVPGLDRPGPATTGWTSPQGTPSGHNRPLP